MHPNPFEFHRATSVDEAIRLLGELEDAKLIAGGHSLLPTMKLRLASPAHLIDIAGVAGLSGIREEGDAVVIGALTTHRAVAESDVLKDACPLLAETAATVGDRQVRNRGTIGGALAHADPAADYPAAIVALDAEIVAQGPNGERTIPAGDFFLGFLTTALEPDEVLTAIRLPKAGARTGQAYEKLSNAASGFAIVGVAAVVELDASGACASAKIGVTGVADHAYRASAVEAALAGKPLDEGTVQAAAKSAADGVEVLGDIHASESYRSRVAQGLVARAVLKAASRAAK